ncbi:MAG: hypothetical protein V3S36_02815 [Acidiferrobacterales bacterium]|jgi:hypothetical protein
MFLPWSRLVLGWAIGKRGKAEEGLALLRQGLEPETVPCTPRFPN